MGFWRFWGVLAVAGGVVASSGAVCAVVELPREIQTLPGAPFATAWGVALSPDEEHVYVASPTDTVAVYDRDPSDGTVALVQTLTDGLGGVDGLDGARGIAVTPDGAHAYVVGFAEDAIAAFSRDALTGALTFVEVERDGIGGVDGLDGPWDVVVSPDGGHVYVTGLSDHAVAVFARDGGTGALTFVETASNGVGGVQNLAVPLDVAIAPDGVHLYVGSIGTATEQPGIVTFARNPVTGSLSHVTSTTDGQALVEVSADGLHVYALRQTVKGATGIVAFARDAGTGLLTKIQDLTERSDGLPHVSPAQGSGILAMSPSGGHLYAITADLLIQFVRDPSTGTLRHQHSELGGHVTSAVAITADGQQLYRPVNGAISVEQLRVAACSPAPAAGCRAPAQPGVAKITVAPSGSLKWKWVRGSETTVTDLGNPEDGDTDYVLCLYDASIDPQPRLAAVAPASGFCRNRRCWSPLLNGFKFRDRSQATGLGTVRLQEGADGKARIIAKGGGPSIEMPALPFLPPVVVQMQHAGGECWEATYGTPLVNDGLQFRATAD